MMSERDADRSSTRSAPSDPQLAAVLRFAEDAGDAVVVVDATCVIRHVGSWVPQLFGHGEELIGQPLERLLPEAERYADAARLRRFAGSGEGRLTMANRRTSMGEHADGWKIPVTVAMSVFDDGTAPLFLAVIRDASDRRRMQDAIQWLATHDHLTGVHTRDALGHLLGNLRGSPHDFPIGIMAVDIEDFGLLNSSIGSGAADKVLIEVARRLSSVTHRLGGHTGRAGSDEFLLLLPGVADAPTAEMVAFQVVEQVGAPMAIGVDELRVRVALGIQIWSGDTPAEQALSEAVAAMASARAQRRRSPVVYDAALRTSEVTRARLARDLEAAIDNGELRMAYQPIVGTSSGRPAAAEALLRWNHPRLGPISPSHFIRLAEESDLIENVWAFSLTESCRQLAEWSGQDWLPAGFSVAVNVSARQLRCPNLLDSVREALAATGVDPSLLCLEVTETAAMHDLDAGADALRSLRRLGVSLALDDFGTGYSSLARLRSLPLDRIKLDGLLTRDLASDDRSVAVVSAILSVAKVFDLAVVAECVETKGQLEVLAGLACPFVQGWWFGGAEPPEAFTRNMRELAAAERKPAGPPGSLLSAEPLAPRPTW
jgi:diguanylate cyclase (GGDEF)-like protein/PAS domain S-box-containing protein